jgi:hypothetical protein
MVETILNNKLELHYFFNDEDKSHTMDAITRNRCEHELLQIVGVISKELGFQIKAETEAHEEGGLVEFYTFIATAQGQAVMTLSNFAITLIGIIVSRIPLRKSKLEIKEQKLSIKEKELNIKAQKINIKLLKQELEAKSIQLPNINIEKIEYIITNNIKIIKHTSNFYKTLYNYPKVRKISTVRIDENRKQLEEPKFVNRNEFEKFFLESDNLEPIIDENATIEIISPVLKRGNYKWRGIYNQNPQPIEFSMNKEFKDKVIEDGIPFKNGTFIDCVIKIDQKIDDLGNVYNSNYSVQTVLKQHNEGISIETIQGKKYREKKEANLNQTRLFENN